MPGLEWCLPFFILKFTSDMMEKDADGVAAILDVKICRNENITFVHSFYEKLMVSDKVIMGDSEQLQEVKVVVLYLLILGSRV